MVDLNSEITDEKLNDIGQVWARGVETALEVANIPAPMARKVLNVLYNRARNDKAKNCTAMQFWKIWRDEENMAVEVNLENLGLVGTCTHVRQISHMTVGFVIDGKLHTQGSGASVRYWKPPLFDTEPVDVRDSLADAAAAVKQYSESVEQTTEAFHGHCRFEPTLIQMHVSPEPLSAAQCYRQAKDVQRTAKGDNVAAGPSNIHSAQSAEWIVQNKAELLGRTVEVRRSPNIHPGNGTYIRGVLEDAWFEYGSAQFIIGGIRCADDYKAVCLVWEPKFCDHIILADRMIRCSKLNNHRGEHDPARRTN